MNQPQTLIQREFLQKLCQRLQANEQQIWQGFPDTDHRAKQTLGRLVSPPWLIIRLILLGGVFLVFIATSVIYHTDAFLTLGYAAILLIALLVGLGGILRRSHVRRVRLLHTLYAITSQRLLILTQDRDQLVENSYYPTDLGRIDLVERSDGWGDLVIGGQQRIQPSGYSFTVTTPRLIGIERVREVFVLLTKLKSESQLRTP